ncbi:MAG: tRNA (N6-isopentenyl adenosine(37)-C2)-methylthiotransferase MiaB [candidate division WOR-3 bacterium]|nr:tRNA (N6-isopentenyl adenosine(37)-C2)-methylthiotransferase MiaB [candidate division WOR-3 bacterium]
MGENLDSNPNAATPTFYLKSYGCQMNFYEAGVVKEILEAKGYIETKDENKADVVLLLTCAVRNHAEARALGRLSSLKRKGNNNGPIIGVLGCMAQNRKQTLATRFGADLVVGPDGYRDLPDLISKFRGKQIPQVCFELNQECYEGIYPKPPGVDKVTGLVSIMRGCNNFCSYCIVPYVRGRERSKNYREILKEVEILSNGGVKDITLVGQNVLAYNNQGLDFCDLIKLVEQFSKVKRIRFITAHPKDFNQGVINTLAGLKRFGPGIHLPLQSGSNRILALMNRHYTREEYLEKIQLARNRIPEVSFTTDIMVGFPTETEEDYLRTLDMVSRIRFDFAYMFQYSPRPMTQANSIEPKVDSNLAHDRLVRLIESQNQITKENSQKLIGKELEVMVEQIKDKQSIARTMNNKIVIIDKPEPLGKILMTKVIAIRGWTPIVEILNSESVKELSKEE